MLCVSFPVWRNLGTGSKVAENRPGAYLAERFRDAAESLCGATDYNETENGFLGTTDLLLLVGMHKNHNSNVGDWTGSGTHDTSSTCSRFDATSSSSVAFTALISCLALLPTLPDKPHSSRLYFQTQLFFFGKQTFAPAPPSSR